MVVIVFIDANLSVAVHLDVGYIAVAVAHFDETLTVPLFEQTQNVELKAIGKEMSLPGSPIFIIDSDRHFGYAVANEIRVEVHFSRVFEVVQLIEHGSVVQALPHLAEAIEFPALRIKGPGAHAELESQEQAVNPDSFRQLPLDHAVVTLLGRATDDPRSDDHDHENYGEETPSVRG